MNNVLDLRMKLINKVLIEWVESIETSNPEEICIWIEQIREEMLEGA